MTTPDPSDLSHLIGSPVIGRYIGPDGRLLVEVRGGDGPEDDTSTDDADTDDQGSPNDGAAENGTDTDTDASDEAAKWKAMARKHERQAKANAAELEKIRKAGMTDTQKAIEEAREAGKAEATKAAMSEIVAAKLEAAGVPAEDVGDLDLTKFLTEDNTIDTDKVTSTGARFKKRSATPSGSADGGPQGGDKPTKATTLEGAVAAHFTGA